MEARVDSIVFRRITYADFRHINKVGGEEIGGGGQSYIDFPTTSISLKNWISFLGKGTDLTKTGKPVWKFNINSLGLSSPVLLKIYQRREASVSIASQKIHSKNSNRVPSWNPKNGFPNDFDPGLKNLVVYIIKTKDNQYWAGWFLQDHIMADWNGNPILQRLFSEDSGYIKFTEKLFIDTEITTWPFYYGALNIINDIPTEEDIEKELILEDTSPKLQELINSGQQPEIRIILQKIRQRNNKLVRNLKHLYRGKCQISGETLTFKKKNGEFYSEVHHLIPLGENGSDSYANAIVVSPLIHRMLHYADVSSIDLSKIESNKLKIKINGIEHTVVWHQDHSNIVKKTLND